MMPMSTIIIVTRIAGIDQRRQRPALHRADDLLVGDVAPDDRIQVAAALAGKQRRRVDGREQRAVLSKRIRQRRAAPDPVVDAVQNRLEGRIRDPLAKDIERLDQRHPGLEQRCQLLVEDQELLPLDPLPTGAQRKGRAQLAAGGRGRTSPFPPVRGADGLRCRRCRRLLRSRQQPCRVDSETPFRPLDPLPYCFGWTNARNTRTPNCRVSELWRPANLAGTNVLSDTTANSTSLALS